MRPPERSRSGCWRSRGRTRAGRGWRCGRGPRGSRAADVDRALSEERSLLITWLNRGTLHLVRSEDYPLAAGADDAAAADLQRARLRQEGVSAGGRRAGVEAIERALAEEGPLTRPQLRERLDARRASRPQGQALVHLLFLAALARHRRARADGRQRARLRPGPRLARAAASRSTATPRWPSWRAATWSATAPPTTATSPAGPACRCATPAPAWRRSPPSWSERARRPRRPRQAPAAEPLPPPRLLGAFDPLLLGWTSREDVVGPHKLLVTNNGIFRPFALVGGRAVATWQLAGGKVEIEHLGR